MKKSKGQELSKTELKMAQHALQMIDSTNSDSKCR